MAHHTRAPSCFSAPPPTPPRSVQTAGFNAVLEGIAELKGLYRDDSAAARELLKTRYPKLSEEKAIKKLMRDEKGQIEIRAKLSIADQLIVQKLVRSVRGGP